MVTDPEPQPPWTVHPGQDYGAFWETLGDSYICTVWRPFWDALGAEERAAYLARFPPAAGWDRFIADIAFDQEIARIDAEDIAAGILQPDGSPWPDAATPRPSLLRRLFRRR